jgi:hypothetical protein
MNCAATWSVSCSCPAAATANLCSAPDGPAGGYVQIRDCGRDRDRPRPDPLRPHRPYGDPDLELALAEGGLDPEATTYRLIEIPLSSITDTQSMPWPRMGTAYVDALKATQQFLPIVVVRNRRGWSLLDGVNRIHGYWVLGTASIRAYELLTPKRRR